ncbi:MAG TPA: TolC family protein [Bryobacteraceae bacterium]|jgi:outer membrane protein TolC
MISTPLQKCAGGLLTLFATVLSAQTQTQAPAAPSILPPPPVPVSGSVNTSQSVINISGQNSVNLINSSVNIQGTYQGSIPSGTATGTVLSINLQEALDRAFKYNLGTVQTGQSVRVARGERMIALSQLLPTLYGSVRESVQQTDLAALGFKSSTFKSSGGGGPSFPSVIGPYNYFDVRATLNQTVFDLSRIHALHASDEREKAADFSARDARDLVAMAAAGAYLQATAAANRIQVAEAAVRTAEAVHTQASDRLKNGLNARIDVTRTEVQLQTDRQRLRALRADLEKQKLVLARVIGLPLDQAFTLSDDFAFAGLTGLTQADAIAKAKAERADVAAASAQVKAAEATYRSIRAAALPSLSVEADYGAIGVNPAQSHGTFGVVGSLVVPIYTGQRLRGATEEASAALEQRRAQSAELQGRVEYEIRQAFIDLDSAADQVSLAGKNVELATDELRQSQDRFGAGVADTVEVVQAQQNVVQANNDLISATYEHNLAKVALARALGQAEKTIPQYLQKVSAKGN